MLKLPRRRFLQLAAGTAALPAASRIAMGETYPTRPITWIVFAAAGGGPDITARLVGQSLSQRLGQAVVIDNRPGAGGNLALQAVARAAADGYTLLLMPTPHPMTATLSDKANVNVARDIAPVAGINNQAFTVVVAPSFPVRTMPEFIAYAKANPGKVNFASSGAGNITHLAGELFKRMAGIDMVHVPYRGDVDAHRGLIGGEVHIMFNGMGSALPQIQAGTLRVLAVTTATRSQALPDIPTVAEFVPNYVVVGKLGVGAPKGTSPEIIDRLNKEINAVLAEPGIKDRFAGFGSEPLPVSPADFGKYISDDTNKFAEIIRAANIKTQ